MVIMSKGSSCFSLDSDLLASINFILRKRGRMVESCFSCLPSAGWEIAITSGKLLSCQISSIGMLYVASYTS